MTLAQILADAYRRLGFETTPATAVTTRFKAYANETQRQILGMRNMSVLRRHTLSFSSIASVNHAVLPQAAVRFYSIQDRTNQRVLQPVGMSWILRQDPGLSTISSTPEVYAVVSYSSPVSRQPSNASQLLVDSTSASDTNTAYLEGVRTGGYYDSSSVTMTGATAVNLGRSDVLEVTKFYLSAAAVGTVTLVEDAEGGTTLATIPIGRLYARYTMVFLWPQPSAAVTLHADVDLHVEDMTNDADEPILPEDFHWMLACGIRIKEYEYKRELKQRAAAEAEYARGLSDLTAHTHRLPAVDAGYSRGFSQLGPYYPDGT